MQVSLFRGLTVVFSVLGLSTLCFAPASHVVADDKKAANALEDEKKPDAPKATAALGAWELEYDYQGTQVVDRYEIKAGEAGEMTGKLLRNGKEVTKLEKIRVKGDTLSFEASGTTDGVDWKAELSGKIDGDTIDGTAKITVNDQTFDLPWKPKRASGNR